VDAVSVPDMVGIKVHYEEKKLLGVFLAFSGTLLTLGSAPNLGSHSGSLIGKKRLRGIPRRFHTLHAFPTRTLETRETSLSLKVKPLCRSVTEAKRKRVARRGRSSSRVLRG